MFWYMSRVQFGTWLASQLERRNMTVADLARLGDSSDPTIWRIIKGERNAGVDSILAIAQGLRMSPVEVFRIATGQPEVSEYEDLIYLFSQLNESDQTTILRMMEVMLDK